MFMKSVEDKIDAIYEMQLELTKNLVKIDTLQEQQRKELDQHRKELNSLNKHKDNFLGKIAATTTFVGGVFTAIGYWISKHW